MPRSTSDSNTTPYNTPPLQRKLENRTTFLPRQILRCSRFQPPLVHFLTTPPTPSYGWRTSSRGTTTSWTQDPRCGRWLISGPPASGQPLSQTLYHTQHLSPAVLPLLAHSPPNSTTDYTNHTAPILTYVSLHTSGSQRQDFSTMQLQASHTYRALPDNHECGTITSTAARFFALIGGDGGIGPRDRAPTHFSKYHSYDNNPLRRQASTMGKGRKILAKKRQPQAASVNMFTDEEEESTDDDATGVEEPEERNVIEGSPDFYEPIQTTEPQDSGQAGTRSPGR
ncbi:hypothetical protein Pcinc_026719 [Petrolisthes cinctipes]|uniref:Uncharacterized protein n=1 Tax=Petrolisthes cinctipes TaxID=88211 RepID=A0AAE1K9N8_PETCI|nr:hypothetical protein Pcinc_026719 [Petrolisthes cinctipes]